MSPTPRWIDAATACRTLSTKPLPRTCVVAGPDLGARDAVVAALRERLGASTAAGTLSVLSGDEAGAGEVAAALDTLPLLAGGPRLVHVRRADQVGGRASGGSKGGRGKKPASESLSLPSGREDAVLVWETDVDRRMAEGKASDALDFLAASDPAALLVDCSLPADAAGRMRLAADAERAQVRLSERALTRLFAAMGADPSRAARTLDALALYVDEAEASEDDVEAVLRAQQVDAFELMKTWSRSVDTADAPGALRAWAEAGGSRADPAAAIGFLTGGLLAALERGYSPLARDPRRAADALEWLRWADECLKSSRGDRETVWVATLAHLTTPRATPMDRDRARPHRMT